METIAPGPAFIGNYVLFVALRQMVVIIGWGLVAALAGAGACWCCGYGGQVAWAKLEAVKRARRAERAGDEPVQDAVLADVARGISEIEEYLAACSSSLPAPQHPAPQRPAPQRLDDEEPG